MKLSDDLLDGEDREVGQAIAEEEGAEADRDDVEEEPEEALVGYCVFEEGLVLGRA